MDSVLLLLTQFFPCGLSSFFVVSGSGIWFLGEPGTLMVLASLVISVLPLMPFFLAVRVTLCFGVLFYHFIMLYY